MPGACRPGSSKWNFIQHTGEATFATLLMVRLDALTGELTYNNAGHPSGRIIDAAGRCTKTMSSTSFPLGVVNGATFPPGPAEWLDAGDWVLLITDGIIDARDKDGEPLDMDRFFELAREVRPGRGAQETAQILLERVAEFTNDEFDDDITVVLIARDAGTSRHSPPIGVRHGPARPREKTQDVNKPLASPGEIVNLCERSSTLGTNQATVRVRTDDVTIIQLLIPAGSSVPIYEAAGEIILHCLEGRVSVATMEAPHELGEGQLLQLAVNEPFSIQGVERASILATVIFPKQGSNLDLIGDQ